MKAKKLEFSDLKEQGIIRLYAGDIPENNENYDGYIGLSITKNDYRHIKFDITNKYPLVDNMVDFYQAEDVLEHIEINKIVDVLNEIYRILKKDGGMFRISVPDYRCDILSDRSIKDDKGEIIFDSFGGGSFENGKVINGGHLWFPKYEIVKELLEKSNFEKYEFLHYYKENGQYVTKRIDYSKGYVQRTPDNDERVKEPYRPMSIVVDCYK